MTDPVVGADCADAGGLTSPVGDLIEPFDAVATVVGPALGGRPRAVTARRAGASEPASRP